MAESRLPMADMETLPPLHFEPIFLNRLWGGRRLGDLLGPLPLDGPVGEAWVLSDQGAALSRVADGPLRGQTLRHLMETSAHALLGADAAKHKRFPLLLKFLDARETLSVQVHPDDRHTELVPPGEGGKNEAWVVLDAGPESRVYAGLKPGTSPADIRRGLKDGSLPEHLPWFTPKAGDCVFIRAGTIHTFGGGLVLFEVQQNSDVTFRLYDWDRVDAQTGKRRQLHIEEALQCMDYSRGPVHPVHPAIETETPVCRERLVRCKHFNLWRLRGSQPFPVGAAGSCRVLVGIEGQAEVVWRSKSYPIGPGMVLLLPADTGICSCQPVASVTLLECGVGEQELA